MHISDWSSDVCSSDLVRRLQRRDDALDARAQLEGVERLPVGGRDVFGAADVVQPGMRGPAAAIVEDGGDRLGVDDLAVVVLPPVGAVAVTPARPTAREASVVLAVRDAVAGTHNPYDQHSPV